MLNCSKAFRAGRVGAMRLSLVLSAGLLLEVPAFAQGDTATDTISDRAKPANKVVKERPVPAVQALPPLRLAQQRIIIRGGFRGRIGPDGMIAAAEGDLNYALFPSNREALRELERARQFLDDNRLADAFSILDDILGDQQDFFFQPDRNQQVHRSLKAEARRLIGKLSADGLAQYDLQFGAAARHLLESSMAAGDWDGVSAVVRRYFNTQAGFEATWLLGRQHLDHGQTLAAALAFQSLYDSPQARDQFEPALSMSLAASWLRAGVPTRAETVLDELRKKGSRPRIAAKEVPLFSDSANALEWLTANIGVPPEAVTAKVAEWAVHRGNTARNAVSSGGSPLLSTLRWQQTLGAETKTNAASEVMNRQLMDANQIDLPAETPLAVAQTAVVRSPRWIVGVDLQTGKRIWEYPTWDSENYTPRQQVMNPRTGMMLTIMPERLSTRNTLASDGRAVFIIEDRGNQPFLFPGAFNPFGRGMTPTGPGSYNKLLARDLATQGKLLWEVGGESSEAEPRLAGAYFLGAPLAMGGQLYVIGELKGEITLFVLDPAQGKLEWSQPLATVETSVAIDSFRRLHGAMPSFVDGVMVCPTSAGAVVAVDIANRSLLWGYQYPRNQATNVYTTRRSGEIANPFGASRWTDGSVILASGRVVITPPDSDYLYCIDLLEGKDAWPKIARGDNLYVGGINRDTVLLVGPKQVQGLKLSNGQPAWPAQSFGGENSGVPSGRGFMTAGHYYLPLTSAEVVKIDMANGKIESRVKSRKGYIPGNLVCYRGNVLSLNDDSLDCFFQLDEREQWAAETLRVRPDDPDALAMDGEILIDQGKLSEGLSQLEKSFALAPNDRVRELLIEAHLEMLRRDFAGHNARAADIEALLAEPAQKAAFAREMALGLQKLGKTVEAFEYFVRMCQPDVPSQELESVIPNELSVRRDRWVRAKIAELRAAASTDERRRMDERIEAHLLDLGGVSNVAALRQFLNYFGDRDAAIDLKSTLVDRLVEEKEFLEAEWWLLRQTRSPNKANAARAYSRLADLMLQLDRPEDAASCYRAIASRFADQPFVNGQNGKQFIAAIGAESPVRRYLSTDLDWPKDVVAEEQLPRTLDYYATQLDLNFGREPFFDHMTLELDTRQQELVGRDGFGREKFRAALNEGRRIIRTGTSNSVPWTRANGHILLIQDRTQILAIDILAAQGAGRGRVLWRHDLADLVAEGGGVLMSTPPGGNRQARPRWVDQRGQSIGGIWPVGNELVCLQRGNKLLGIDVFSGHVLWTRQDVQPTDEIFGDDQYLFVVPTNGNQVMVLQALDGAKAGTRRISANDRILTYGRKAVAFGMVDGKSVIRVYDAWAEQELWRGEFTPNAKIESIDSDQFAVMDPAGHLVIYSLDDEQIVVDHQAKADARLAELVVFRSLDRYIVLAARQVQFRNGMAHLYPVQNTASRSQPVVEGRLFGFARDTGKLQWERDLPPTASLLNQPAYVPLLIFAMNVNEQSPKPGAQKTTTDVVCLDTRDGRIVYNQKLNNVSAIVVPIVDPSQRTLEIRCTSTTATIKFGVKEQESPNNGKDSTR